MQEKYIKLESYTCIVMIISCGLIGGQRTNEMLEQGRIQYQLIKDRVSHPKYGSCWKQAVEHVDEGCRSLSERTQSGIALHLADCFLEMSGHQTYGCQNDKKQNLRAICVSNMDDRAFNVYTEFYTHTQEMCWFLQGQVWQEAMTQNSRRVGDQLRVSANNQKELLDKQKLSLEYGVALEGILKSFMEASRNHQEILGMLSASVGSLQAWIVGEMSWIDTVIFYVSYLLLVMVFTASPRTSNARMIILFVSVAYMLVERFLCRQMTTGDSLLNVQEVHAKYYAYLWYLRYTLMVLTALILILHVYMYKDYVVENNILLQQLHARIEFIVRNLNPHNSNDVCVDVTSKPESYCVNKFPNESNVSVCNALLENSNLNASNSIAQSKDLQITCNFINSTNFTSTPKTDPLKDSNNLSQRKKLNPLVELQDKTRYNLRSRNATPDLL